MLYTNASNYPTNMYCPSFISEKFQPLNFSLKSRQYSFSHIEPFHKFSASINNKLGFSIQNDKTDDKSWLWSLIFHLTPQISLTINNPNKFNVQISTDDNSSLISIKNDCLFCLTQTVFDSFPTTFAFSLGNPMRFRAYFRVNETTFGCCVSTNDTTRSQNFFTHIYENLPFSIGNTIYFNNSSISQFAVISSMSLKYSFCRLGCTVFFGQNTTSFSTGFKYQKDRFKFGVYGNCNLMADSNGEYFQYKTGVLYRFSDALASKFVVSRHFCSVGGSILYRNNKIEPGIMFKYNEPRIGFKFSFTTPD